MYSVGENSVEAPTVLERYDGQLSSLPTSARRCYAKSRGYTACTAGRVYWRPNA